ncbi:MAG TPA: cellulase [Verrucomicrobiae bacterium]|nr:cellulase [Verrucomicrobiae bacterium]
MKVVVCLIAFLGGFSGVVKAESPAPPRSEPYVWRNVVIGGGGFVTGIVMHPREKGLMYARTDVGGAYRWDPTAEEWIPITDWVGMADVNLTGIESLAVDPSDPNRVYLAAGTYSGGPAAILRSADRGKTFMRTDVPFRMGGNESGRFNGERLAVDPNDGNILFFGSRRDGLWRSVDRGATWKNVESFPNIPTNRPPVAAMTNTFGNARRRFNFPYQPVGIVSVVFDPTTATPGHRTPLIYAAGSTLSTNLFRSSDGGETWQAVEGQPVGLCPVHLVRASDGLLYATYGREPGPSIMTDGAVWKFDPKKNTWTDITPIKPTTSDQRFGYGGITVDARRPSTIMVTTFWHWKPHDLIFRSTNGGATWIQLWQENTEWDHSSAPYTETQPPHWMGDIEINPFDSRQVLFTTGYGIWSCPDITAADAGHPTHWEFLDRGLEETVPLGLISPPEGAHLLSALGDQDGFRHDDLTRSPKQGRYPEPRFSNGECITFAGKNPQVIARTGSGNQPVHAAISRDGGTTWRALGSEPPDSNGAGTITLSADGKIMVWIPRRSAPYRSTDCGTNWVACLGLGPRLSVVADPVNSKRFYALDPDSGRLLVSTNGAVSFVAEGAELPTGVGFPGGFGGGGGADGVLYAAPDSEGDLWLASRAHGLYHSTDGGGSFTKLGTVDEAYSLGFGKAAPGRDWPALYLAGRIGGVQALFRSDDNGTTWARINDNQHQYGWINHVTGDPRIYGRVYFATGGRGIIYGDPAAPLTVQGR